VVPQSLKGLIKNASLIKKENLNVYKQTYSLTSVREDWSLTKHAINSFAAPASTFFKNNVPIT
jgi:hypothetical protein